MTKELTAQDQADYRVRVVTGHGTDVHTVRAAYDVADEKHPGWLLFKDDAHRTVARFNANNVVMVERIRSETA